MKLHELLALKVIACL